jgi:pilus assembly protein CpaE
VGPPDVPPALLLEAMRVGASEYLKTPYEYAELAASLARAARRIGAVPTPEAHEPGRIYAFYAAKGGAGVTTASTNFAVWLKEATHQSTLLVDLDLDMGGSATTLGLHPRYSFSDFVRNLHRMDRNLLESLVDHHESGLDVLASPGQPNGSETFTKDQVRSALHYLRRNYENIVIDLARAVNQVTLTALERADDVVFLTTPDLPSLRNTKKVLPLVQRAVAGGNDHIHVVLNRVRPNDLIQSKDVREALGLDVYWSLASDEDAITESANEGRPVVLRPKSKYSKDIHGLVQQLAAATNGKSTSGKGGGFLKPFRRSAKE